MKKFARAIILNDAGKLLVVKNLDRGRYEFPGGKVDKGETTFQTVVREVREEIGVEVTFGQRVSTRKMTAPESGQKWIGDFYLCRIKGKPRIREPKKLGDLRWVSAEELLQLPQIPWVAVDLLETLPESWVA